MQQPLVSIVFLAMNHDKFVEQACESIYNQTYKNLEVVFIDNNSTDKTYEKVNAFFQEKTIEFRSKKNTVNQVVADNLNELVAMAKGEFVLILSGDDWLHQDMIQDKINYINTHKVDVVYSDGYKFINNENKLIDAYNEKSKNRIIHNLARFFEENVVENQTVNVGVFLRRQLLLDDPFDKEVFAEDWDMNLKMTYKSYKIGFIDKKLFYYRILSNSASRNSIKMEDAYIKITNKYLDFIKSKPNLLKKYQLKRLQFQFEIKIQNAELKEIPALKKQWKIEKYRLKYNKFLAFLKIQWLNINS